MNTAQNLADRYGVSKAAILAFVKSNLDIINKDGCNAYQTGTKKSWEFTDEAVRIIDKLRNVSSSVAERPADAERVIELQQEISTLKTALLLSQKETADALKEASEHKSKIIMLLETAPKELAAAQSDIAVLQNEREASEKRISELQAELEAEKQKSWWQKLWGR